MLTRETMTLTMTTSRETPSCVCRTGTTSVVAGGTQHLSTSHAPFVVGRGPSADHAASF